MLSGVCDGFEVRGRDVGEADVRERRGDPAELIRKGSSIRCGWHTASRRRTGRRTREGGEKGAAEASEDTQLATDGCTDFCEAVVEALL